MTTGYKWVEILIHQTPACHLPSHTQPVNGPDAPAPFYLFFQAPYPRQPSCYIGLLAELPILESTAQLSTLSHSQVSALASDTQHPQSVRC